MSSESKIVRQIDEIEDYIEGCKYMRFSNDNIVVSKERLASMLEQLRDLTPQEILHYQSIIDRKDEILEDARRKADDLMEQATYKFNESLNENAVMQEAYKQADELVRQGANQGQAILTQAIAVANSYRSQAASYVDGMLAEMEKELAHVPKSRFYTPSRRVKHLVLRYLPHVAGWYYDRKARKMIED